MIPTHYPVTMVDPAGREYDVHNAMEYVSAKFKRGHEVLEPKPKPQAKVEPEPKVEPPKAAPITTATNTPRT